MKTQVGTWYLATGEVKKVLPSKGRKFTLEELQTYVSGYIEIVQLRPGNGHKKLYVNEEAKLRRLPRNDRATQLMSDHHAVSDYIAGDALLVGTE